jgi:hypothetical protein
MNTYKHVLNSYKGWTFVFGIISDALPPDCRDPIAVSDALESRLRESFPDAEIKILIQGSAQTGTMLVRPRVITPDGIAHTDSGEYVKMMAIWEAIIHAGLPDA